MSKVMVAIEETARDKARTIANKLSLKRNENVTIGEATEEAIEAYLKKLEEVA
jgi:hypothetical protein